MSYRPLPAGLMIGQSAIDGQGLFTGVFLGAESSLGVARQVIADRTGNPAQLRTPLGGFVNHSEEPNCIMARSATVDFGKCVVLVTLRDIMPGEELTVSYDLPEYEGASWK